MSLLVANPQAELKPSHRCAMRRAVLIYNPASGQRSRRRILAVVEGAQKLLRAAGVETEAWPTYAPGSAAELAQRAIDLGFDTVIACGGDGTIHDVLQRLAGSQVQLGVAPMGTANALAMNLGLGAAPLKAVAKLLAAEPRRVPVGRVHYRDKSGAEAWRYFTVTAGVGADAYFLSRLDAGLKRRWGYLSYIVEAFHVWARYSFPHFEAAYRRRSEQTPVAHSITQLFAVRIRDFGGLLHRLAPGASLHKKSLSLIGFRTGKRLDYFSFFMAVILQRHRFERRIELIEAESVELRNLPGDETTFWVEADGEVLGTLPARLEISAQELTILVPPGVRP